jgi:hypothetical protein
MFYATQSKETQERYKHYLTIMGKLSRLFTTSGNLYLDSRVSEIVFCEAFQAYNTSRDDSTSDANINNLGVGIKTFLHNDSCYQKIAEFNAARKYYKDFKDTELMQYLAEARNERIRLTQAQYGLERLIYHYVTKTTKAFSIFEQEMPVINTASLKIKKSDERSLIFTDELKEYNFNRSKSVLQMRFDSLLPIDTLEVDVLENPLSFLERCFEKSEYSSILTPIKSKVLDEIYLPLYSTQPKQYGEVQEKSALNQWCAGGRKRNYGEVYIPVPKEIHKLKPNFFPSRDTRFQLQLPNKTFILSKLCQQNAKALMSYSNTALGEWLLEDVFKRNPLNPQPITREYLNTIGIDAVKISKLDETHYAIDFAKIGSFEDFLLAQDNLSDSWRNRLTDLANG